MFYVERRFSFSVSSADRLYFYTAGLVLLFGVCFWLLDAVDVGVVVSVAVCVVAFFLATFYELVVYASYSIVFFCA